MSRPPIWAPTVNKDMEQKNFAASKRVYNLVLCLSGLIINILGVKIALTFELPLFLDNIGSALAAALGGFIPGIIVGFFTNLVNGIGDYTTTYYGSLTVLIAICSAYFSIKGYYSSLRKLPIIIITFALIGGGLGSVLTWMLYGFDFGTGISAPLAHTIYSYGTLDLFWSQFAADMLIDVTDKTITVLIVALALKLIPDHIKELFSYSGWRQTPVSLKAMLEEDNHFLHKKSLRRKIIQVVALATLVTAIVVTTISFIHFRDASVNEKLHLAEGVTNVMKESLDPDRIDEYIEKGEDAEGYKKIADLFRNLMESSEYVEFCYVYRIEEDGCHVVFDPDANELTGAKPGEVVPFDDDFKDYIPALLAGEPIEPVTSHSEYGWLMTVYAPVYDSNGVCQCYAAVDMNMSHIAVDGYQFLARVISLFFGFFIMILTVTIWLAEYNVILPINSMAMMANNFAFNSEEARANAIESIERLNIRTEDEIENLYNAIVKTTKDMADTTGEMAMFIAHIQKQSEVIGKLQSGLILVLADMVESRDQNTGEHVRKTAAYTGIIMRELRREHIYEDELTDAFVEDVVTSAPLHDVGKIQVPDAILNKPGKLTDEEFEIMKTHTTAGSEIIESAMQMVSESDSGYLKEAKNLAHYHHEKWNGTGYPQGLKGTAIPLSARIMAVADVFDALVSKRSYKEGFPFEKAMGIIKEGSGSHFDPHIAEAFLNASDEVYKVMQSHMSR